MTWAALLTGEVTPPAWRGPVREHRLSDDDPCPELAPPRAKPGPLKGSKPSPKGTRRPRLSNAKQARELRALQRRAQEAVLRVLPAWKLIEPGSPSEQLLRQVPPSWYWPKP